VKRNGPFSWRNYAIGIGVAALMQIHWLNVIGTFVDKPPPELEVTWMPDGNDAPVADKADEPAPPDEPTPPEKDKKKEKQKPKPEKLAEQKPAPEPAKVEEKKKEAELELKPVKPPPPPPPQPLMDHRMQMVDQDNFPDEQDNQDAHYLAQKNHKAEQETSAKNTNLVRSVQAPDTAQSEKSDNQQPDPGMKNDKLAELQNRDGQKNEVVRNMPLAGQEGQAAPHEPTPAGPLAMRNLTPKAAIDPVEAQKAREGLDKQEGPGGELPMARVGRDQQRAVAPTMGANKPNLNLNHHMYDEIEGAAAEAERRVAAKAEKSHKAGRYDRYLAKAAAMRSSIENFTPAVRPGNQAELGTRASPFAAYITAMHRQIHKLFTLGFLADIELRSDSAYANDELWTQLEIVVKGDGSVERVGIVRPSGVLAFDVAAIDSVMSAAPFPPPPSVIKSANGKVYLDWQFHRDDRACGTFGVDPHILTTVEENHEHDTSETGAQAKAMEKAARLAQGSKGSAAGAAGAAAGAAAGGALDLSHAAAEGPRRLSREPTARPRGDDDIPTAKPAVAPTVVVPEVTDEVRTAAEGWFAAYTRGDVAWLAGWSATPFTAAGEVVARDAGTLKGMYRQLLAEAPRARNKPQMEVLTPAGIRGRLGGLPPGGEASEMLFAVGKVGTEEFILLLKKSSQGWRVCGIDR
jgi:TonB family protein